MEKRILVAIRHAYGQEFIDCKSDHKDALHRLTGRKTLTESDISALKSLGFEIVNITPNREF